MDLLGDVGGVQQALTLIGGFILSQITKRLFLSRLIKELYQTKFKREANVSQIPVVDSTGKIVMGPSHNKSFSTSTDPILPSRIPQIKENKVGHKTDS